MFSIERIIYNQLYLTTIALTTTQLVAAVVAVQYAVTLVRFLYALSEVGAFELCR